MICPKCGSRTRTTETRQVDNFVRRLQVCPRDRCDFCGISHETWHLRLSKTRRKGRVIGGLPSINNGEQP
jgi:hypothetical protein